MDLLRSYDSDKKSSDDSEFTREALCEKDVRAVYLLT